MPGGAGVGEWGARITGLGFCVCLPGVRGVPRVLALSRRHER